MKISICSSLLILLVIILSSNFGPSVEETFPVSKNVFIFERLTCRLHDGSKISDLICRVKYIDRNHLKGIMSMNFTVPLIDLQLRGAMYFKYNTYMKIATELRDDLCGWFEGKHMSYFLDFLRPLLSKYTNVNHTCPYSGVVVGKTDNISAQHFAFPQILPAGRYRLDFNLTQGDRQTSLVGCSLYFAISDHRIEIV